MWTFTKLKLKESTVEKDKNKKEQNTAFLSLFRSFICVTSFGVLFEKIRSCLCLARRF